MHNSFLPDFCSNKTAFIVVIAAELLAIVLALATFTNGTDFWHQLALNSLFIQWVALGTVAILCALRKILRGLGTIAATLLAYITVQTVTLLSSLAAILILPASSLHFDTNSFSHSIEPFYLLRNFTISSIVSLVVLRYFYIQQQWRQNVQAEARSQLQALQSRIRPHFLFNSMNAIANLVREQPDQAEEMVLDLADLFRAALARKDKISLQDELDIARRYLRIEQQRLGSRLQVNWSNTIDPALETSVPALILQPLLENAVYHGIQSLPDGGTIDIDLSLKDKLLLFRIANSTDASGLRQGYQGQGIAQDNIRRRLQLTYGEDAYLHIQHRYGRYQIELAIPFIKPQA